MFTFSNCLWTKLVTTSPSRRNFSKFEFFFVQNLFSDFLASCRWLPKELTFFRCWTRHRATISSSKTRWRPFSCKPATTSRIVPWHSRCRLFRTWTLSSRSRDRLEHPHRIVSACVAWKIFWLRNNRCFCRRFSQQQQQWVPARTAEHGTFSAGSVLQ